LDIEPWHAVIATTRPAIMPVIKGKITKAFAISPGGYCQLKNEKNPMLS
jgi:hypothetical protein